MTISRPRVGILGGGGIANSHVEGLREAGCDVVAVADPSEAARAKMVEKYQLKAFSSTADLFAAEQLDAVSVCAPNSLHAPLSIQAMEAGCAVLCEKPPATCLADAVKMRDTAKRTGKLLMMGFNQRFDAPSQQLDRMRRAGVFGDIYHAKTAWVRRRGIPGMGGWFTTKALSGGGVAYDIGIHVIDRAWFVMGRPKPVAVSAVTYAKFGDLNRYVCEHMWAGPRRMNGTCDTEDFAAALVRFEGGASMQIEVSWAANRDDESPKSMVMGDKAGAYWESDKVTLYGEQDNCITTSALAYDKSIYDNRFQHFAKCLRGEAQCSCTGDDGVAIQAILDAIYRSGAENREVAVEIPAAAAAAR